MDQSTAQHTLQTKIKTANILGSQIKTKYANRTEGKPIIYQTLTMNYPEKINKEGLKAMNYRQY